MNKQLDVSYANDQIQLFQVVSEEVRDSEDRSLKLLQEAGSHLRILFDAANEDGNDALAQAINEAWERTQNIVSIVQRQAIALRGGVEVFNMLKTQRDKVTGELNTILRGLYMGDRDTHPAIKAFAKELKNWEDEVLQQLEEEAMEEMFRQLVTRMFEKYTRHHYQEQLDGAADGLFDIIIEDVQPTTEQVQLLQQLAETFYPEE